MTTKQRLNQLLFDRLRNDYEVSIDHSGVSGNRLASRLAELANIGLTEDDGCNRISFSKEERQAKELVKTWMKEAGLTVVEDGAGNVFGRLEGKEELPAVLSGSHVDSVPNGGHFDGPLGVLAALEVAEAWKETNFQPKKPFEVVIFTDEEGARFNGGLTGSRAFTGEFDLEQQVKLNDFDGRSFQEVVEADGLSAEGFLEAKRDFSTVDSFVEVHIEQGKRLEKQDLPVGVVTGIAGPCWLNVTFKGKAGHAGNTPMNDRNDALTAASEFVLQVQKLPSTVSSSAVATVGKLQVSPNGVNVIPGEVRLTVDIRDIHEDTRNQLTELVIQAAERISDNNDIELSIEETLKVSPVPIDETMQAKAGQAAQEILGKEAFYLPSGAGHDAMVVGRYVPTAMLFTRSKDGVSHNPAEWSSLYDCVQTVHVLKKFLEKLVE
ncbi:Zn-dependent hydrolase [Aquibacillus albus]|uniref:Allantoate deiminase n=1 Tax=Aquibacillus albus TaxID=1168171 RepID=A0ABS2MWS3_9BACI|nr:Zn-dependent hydrolase [Aquibacillus albus]MBM7570351.1 allantoate deiminase [Aquibacillus albus]